MYGHTQTYTHIFSVQFWHHLNTQRLTRNGRTCRQPHSVPKLFLFSLFLLFLSSPSSFFFLPPFFLLSLLLFLLPLLLHSLSPVQLLLLLPSLSLRFFPLSSLLLFFLLSSDLFHPLSRNFKLLTLTQPVNKDIESPVSAIHTQMYRWAHRVTALCNRVANCKDQHTIAFANLWL